MYSLLNKKFITHVTKKKLFILFSVLYAVTLLFTRIYSVSIDNFLISCVLSGLYDTENYCIYVHPFIANIVGLLNKFFPNADFFCFFQILFTFLGYVWLLFCLYNSTDSVFFYFICSVVLFSLSTLLNIAHSNFTIAAAFFAFVGFVSLGNSINCKLDLIGIIAGIFFICLGLLWRIQAVLLLLPYFLLTSVLSPFLISEAAQKRATSMRSIFCVLLVLISFSILYFSKNRTDSSPAYSAAVEYNTARANLQDYPNPSYEEVAEELGNFGISKNDYLAVTDMLFLDTKLENSSFLRRLANIFAAKTTPTFSRFLSMFIDNAADYSLVSILFLLIVALLYVVFVLLSRNKIIILELLCSIAGSVLIILYFIVLGRLLDRILIAVLFGFLQITLVRFPKLTIDINVKKKCRLIPVCLCLSLSLLLSFIVFFHNISLPQNPFRAKADANYGLYDVLLDNKYFFIWDNHYIKNLVLETLVPQGKLYTKEFIDNNISDGAWTYGQLYFYNYLSRLGIDNPIEELLFNDRCYYIGRQSRINILLQYIHEHYDPHAVVIQCGDIVLDSNRSLAIYKIISRAAHN